MPNNAPRFPEPSDPNANVWRIFGTYAPDIAVVYEKARPYDEIIPFDEVDLQTCWLEYDLERMMSADEPDIIDIRAHTVNKAGKEVKLEMSAAFYVASASFLEDKARWEAAKAWLEEYGDREYYKDNAA